MSQAPKPEAADSLRIATVCRALPSDENPGNGVYVLRRAAAMAQLAPLRFLQPVPWFPLLRPRGAVQSGQGRVQGVAVTRTPMFYVPGVLKTWDGHWLARAVTPVLRRWQQAGEVTLIDAHFGYPDGVGCVRAGRQLGLPVFITMRGLEEDYLRHPRIGPRLAQALREATGVVTVSHSLARLAREHGVPDAQLRVIQNAVDDTLFHPGSRAAARQELGWPAERPLVVSVANLLERKGHHVLIEAIGDLRRKRPEVGLVVLGGAAHEPAYPARLERLIEQQGLQGSVRLPGAVTADQVAIWLRAADVFSLATEREGCCNAVLEALASGLPVVTTPVGDNAFFVEPDRDGALAPVGSVEGFAAALDRVLGRSWNAAEIAARVTQGGWLKVGRQVLDFFQERLAATAGGTR